MEKLEDYFSDVDILNVSLSEMEMGRYFTSLNSKYLNHLRVLNCKPFDLSVAQDTLE